MQKVMTALLLSLICNPQSHEYLLLLWGWTGPLFCHTSTYCFFEAELVLSFAIQVPTASLRLNCSSLLPYKYLLFLWGWTGPLFCHTSTYCFFKAELVLSSVVQVTTVSVDCLERYCLLSHKYLLLLWGWTAWSSLLSHKYLLLLWGELPRQVLPPVPQVPTVSVNCLDRYCLLSHKHLLLLWGELPGPLFCCTSTYCFYELPGPFFCSTSTYCFFEVELVLSSVPQVLTVSLRLNWSSLLLHKYLLFLWTAWKGTASYPTNIYCFFEVNCLVLSFVAQVRIVLMNCLVLSSVPEVLTASLMLNCLDRYCLLSRTISRSKVMSWLPAITTFSLWGSVPGTQVKLKMQSTTSLSLYGKLVRLVKKSKLNHDWNATDW